MHPEINVSKHSRQISYNIVKDLWKRSKKCHIEHGTTAEIRGRRWRGKQNNKGEDSTCHPGKRAKA